jgi:hypothetical protein
MFGGPQKSAIPPQGNSNRPQTGDVAKITGNLTHVIVTSEDIDGLHVFYNGQPVLTGQLENIGVEIVAPDDSGNGTLTGVLTRYEGGAEGARTTRSFSLFPGTLEVIAKGKRITIVCPNEGSFDGLALLFGTANYDGVIDNIGMDARGVQSLRIVITPGLVDAKLVWIEDQREDTILP